MACGVRTPLQAADGTNNRAHIQEHPRLAGERTLSFLERHPC